MEKLSIHGGQPVRETKIHYGRQYIDDDDVAAVAAALREPLITQGPKVMAFEHELCAVTGAKFAVVLANGTAALHIACLAAGIVPGDEVITTPMTFAASANCILYCGATPVFADIDPRTYNISPASIREKITSKTKAVIAVDFTGQAVELDEIRKICTDHHLLLMEDAAHAIGTRYNGTPIGSIADLTTFSFHPVKTITGGEGGAVTTNDPDLFKRLSLFRTHGITRDKTLMVHEPHGPWYYEQLELGFNYRITDFQAALLSSQLKKLPMFSARRKEIARIYDTAFSNMDGIVLQESIPQSDTTRHLYIIQLELEKLTSTRREIFEALYAENVCPNVHYIPVYYLPYYEKLGYERGLCPNAEWLYERILSIPLYYGLTDDDVADTIKAIEKVLAYYYK